jgi:hypothetical protein
MLVVCLPSTSGSWLMVTFTSICNVLSNICSPFLFLSYYYPLLHPSKEREDICYCLWNDRCIVKWNSPGIMRLNRSATWASSIEAQSFYLPNICNTLQLVMLFELFMSSLSFRRVPITHFIWTLMTALCFNNCYTSEIFQPIVQLLLD